jgi:4-amino-4-deoxy-L-arabinose transferase-like glycosyltransferase
LGSAGWGYGIYSAAVQAGTKSFKAALFGSLDAGNFITVDKPPAALWVMEVSARLFGLSSWSVLGPQALEGVATVALVYLTVRRWSGPVAGLVAAGVTALTPVSVAMFRFNDPDALMVLLLVGAAYATVRSAEATLSQWSWFAGALVGLAFLAKMSEAFLVVPGLVGAYWLAARGSGRQKAAEVARGGLSLVVVAGWWVAIVQFTPVGARPYIGSTKDNSLMSLIFGYNGFDRLVGGVRGSFGGGDGFLGARGAALRLFGQEMGSQVAWFLPAALLLGVTAWIAARNEPVWRRTRAALVLWGGWVLAMGGVFSLGRGAINPYYTVALAPAIAAIVGTGGTLLWVHRDARVVVWVLGAALVSTAVWSFDLLDRDASWAPWLRGVVLATGVGATASVFAWPRVGRFVKGGAVVLSGFALLAGPGAYSAGAVLNAPANADPYAYLPFGRHVWSPAGAGGGQGEISRPNGELVRLLRSKQGQYRWVVAAVGDDPAAGYQLATGDPAMAVGGWSGTDPAPSLREFERLVRQHEVHYFIPANPRGGFPLGRSYYATDANQITRWVEARFRSMAVGGIVAYDLTGPQGPG